MVRKGLEVLRDRSEVELVACTGDAPQPHALKAMMGLEVGKSHFDSLALVARFAELRLPHPCARYITRILMHVPRNLPEGHIRNAFGLEMA